MLHSKGLRLALFGGALFLLSTVAIIFLPKAVGMAGMLIGGMCVWTGFVWTLFSFYTSPAKPPDDS